MSTNIQWQSFKLTEDDRAKIKHQQPLCLRMTGLSGAGKSTLANALEEKLNQLGKHTYILDGDNLRHGLNQDLGFSMRARNEHWVVVKGKATIIQDDKKMTFEHDQSTYIKKGVKHQLINNEKTNLEIIEVQTGNKVIEENIQRFEDIYGRVFRK